MSNFSESELIPAAVRIILKETNGIETKDLITELRNLMVPSGEDLERLSNRSDDKFSQKVRNLKSHKTLENKGYSKFYDNKFFITEKGKKFLNEIPLESTNNNSRNIDKKLEKILLINVHEDIPISARLSNSLKDQGIIFIEQLICYTEKQLLTFPRLGSRGIQEIENILTDLGLSINCSDNISNIALDNTLNVQKKDSYSPKKIDSKILKKLSINILCDWPLSVRTINICKKENIIFLGDLLFKRPEYLLKSKNFGRKSLNEINEFIKRYDINLEDFNIGQNDWQNLREKLIFELKYKQISNEVDSREFTINENVWANKSIFEDFNSFKKDYLQINKIEVTTKIKPADLEQLIIEDVSYIDSLFTKKYKKIFRSRYGYKEKFQTLSEIGKELQVTRERVRQLESKLNRSFSKLGRIEKKSILNYFKQYSSLSFNNLFPNLSKNFYEHSTTYGTATKNKFTSFMELYSGVKKGYFNTTEKILDDSNFSTLEEIFRIIPSGVTKEFFLEKIKNNYGYDDYTSEETLNFMEKKKLIKIYNNKIYLIKLSKTSEVSNILIDHRNGLHWKKICEIGNNSFSNNSWNINRLVADHSISMFYNQEIYLCDVGTYKLLKYCKELYRSDKIISECKMYLLNNNLDKCLLKKVCEHVRKKKYFFNVNIYDVRAIIKVFGANLGLFHNGKSGSDTIGLQKDIKISSLSTEILEIINNSNDEIDYKNILKKLNIDENHNISNILSNLVSDMKIFRTGPGSYANLKISLDQFDEDQFTAFYNILLDRYLFLTRTFISEKMNEKFGYGLSTYFYDSISRLLSKKNNWYYGSNYLSKQKEKNETVQEYLDKNKKNNLSTDENFEIISSRIGISRRYFDSVIYNMDNIDNGMFNTDWVHEDD